MTLLDSPLFSEEHTPNGYRPPLGSAYLYAVTTEDRSAQAVRLRSEVPTTTFHELREPEDSAFETDVVDHEYVQVRDARQVASFLASLGAHHIVLDITGLKHTSWAPLVKVALETRAELTVVYHEPEQYALSPSPRIGDFYDLSESTDGIGPLPLFVNIAEVDEASVVYVPLLGFEGQRSAFMHERVGLDARRMYPIIGLPGFRLEYPFEAFIGNSQLLRETKGYRDVRFARSNCPFSLFLRLEEIRSQHPDAMMRVGLTGTKPHALGAVLFALSDPGPVELVYDHVRRKARRTAGTDRCVVYRLSAFMRREA